MKTIGMLGGMGWPSTMEYYRIINRYINEKTDGEHTARMLIYSVDYHEIEHRNRTGDWGEGGKKMAKYAQILEKGGADFLIICSNTTHKVAPQVESAVDIPLLHIVDPTAKAIKKEGLEKIGILGSKFTLEQDFLLEKLRIRGLFPLIPDEEEVDNVNNIIYNELVYNKVKPESKTCFREVIRNLIEKGAQGIIFGCTEIITLVPPNEVPVPVFNTTWLHAIAAVEYAMGP